MGKRPLPLLVRLRGAIQAAAALLTNIHLPNFLSGRLYQGNGKRVCVPGLNCYSCPGAAGACPIGAFQAVVGSSGFRFCYYITGLLILLGVMAYKLVEVYGDLSAAKEQEARLRTQVEQKEEENNSLKDALSHADDPDYILGLARDRLGLAEDGERIFPDVNN